MHDQTPSVKPNGLSRALLAGFISATVMMYVFAVAFWLATLSPRYLGIGHYQLAEWIRNLTFNMLVARFQSLLAVSIVFHLVVGLGWAVLYALVFEPRLSGPGWRRGMMFSLVPWLISIVAFFPLMGAGILGLNLGAGPLPAIGNLILHLMYGLTLGVAYSPAGETVAVSGASNEERSLETSAMLLPTQRAAQGLVVGLILGTLVGTSLSVSPGNMSSSYMVMAGMLMGGALGCLVGAFAGLPTYHARVKQHK